MNERKEVLKRLLTIEGNINEIISLLNKFEWDSKESIVILDSNSIIQVLNRYINGNITSQTVENWANAIEGRDDIDIENSNYNLINDIIFELANPFLIQSMSVIRAKQLVVVLNK